MKKKKIVFYLLWLIIGILFVGRIGTTYARYVISKTVDVAISTTATETTGTINYTIINENNLYTVSDNSEEIEIKSNIQLENKDNIDIKAYYVWINSNTEPSSDDYTEFTFEDNNTYVATKTNTTIGTYKLWVKITYISEVGEEKEVIQTSRSISVVLGNIDINLEDEESEYLTGNVNANITYKGEYYRNPVIGYGLTEEEAKTNAETVTLDKNLSTTITVKDTTSEIYYIYAYGEDADGNPISVVRTIENIDNTKPTIDSATANYTRVKLRLSDNKSGVKYYTATTTNAVPSLEDYTYTLAVASTSVTDVYIEELSPNTTYYIWVRDSVGNVTSTEVKTKSVDYTISPDLTVWTKSTNVKFNNLSDCTLTYKIGSSAGSTLSYDLTNGITLTQNTTIYYTLQDGKKSVTGSIDITNIDVLAPTISTTSDYYKVTLTAKDTESGITGYIVTSTQIEDTENITFTKVTNTSDLTQEITQDYLGNSLIYNTTYYIYVKDDVGNISMTSVISKIDEVNPLVSINSTSSTTNTATVKVDAVDNETGLDGTYKYYISKTEGDFSESEVIESTSSSHTFTELEDDVTWYVKIVVTDLAGNQSEIETSIYTEELLIKDENTDIIFSNALWASNIQTVKITTTTGYKLRYQIVGSSETISQDLQDWSSPISSGDTVTGLKNGDILYIKIYDGTNTSNNYASYNVINEMAVNYPTLTEGQMSAISKGSFDILTYSVDTSIATVSANLANTSTKTYNYYIKNIKSDTYELKMTSSTYNEQVKVEEKTEEQTYEVVLVELANNTEGTLSRSQNTSIVISREEAVEGKYYSTNRSYTDSENYVATVPAGFTVSSVEGENVISSGLVLKDETENEYVWVPVNNAIYDETTTIPTSTSGSSTYKPMVRKQDGSTNYYERIYYTFSGVKSYTSTSASYKLGGNSYIEPSLITGSSRDGYTWNLGSSYYGFLYDVDSSNYLDVLGFDSAQSFGNYINDEYKDTIDSIDIYKGFYIGRYETTEVDGTIGSKKQANILNNVNWYNLYKYQNSSLYSNNSLYSSNTVSATMVYGAEYDAMLNWMLTGNDASKVTTNNLGNKSNALSTTGGYEEDKINNVYDLSSNAYESTLESNSYQYRIYRGGGYDSTNVTNKSASTKSNILPLETGAIIGSRMAVYLLDEGDNIPPTFTFTLEQTSNTITVDVTAEDEGTGARNFHYSIALSSDGENWSDDVVTTENKHTFTGLASETEYYIRVRVADRVGNLSDYIVKSCTTNVINVTTDAVTVHRIYGKDGEGVALLDIKDTYNDLGYYIEYQVGKSGAMIDENGEWTKGDSVSGLSVGDIIYIRIADDENKINTMLTVTIKELETFTEIYDETTSYTDSNGDTAYIPSGFKRGNSSVNNTVDKGLVIEDESGNQFVWVPVDPDKVIYDGTTSIPTTESTAETDETFYRPMARYQTGSNSKFYESMYYTFLTGGYSYWETSSKLGANNYSEPRLVLGQAYYTWDLENTRGK